MNEALFSGPIIPLEQTILTHPYKMLSGWMHSERRVDVHWSGDLLFADWDDLEKSIASEVHVKRTESQDVQVTREHMTDHSSKRNTWYLDLFAIDKSEKKE